MSTSPRERLFADVSQRPMAEGSCNPARATRLRGMARRSPPGRPCAERPGLLVLRVDFPISRKLLPAKGMIVRNGDLRLTGGIAREKRLRGWSYPFPIRRCRRAQSRFVMTCRTQRPPWHPIRGKLECQSSLRDSGVLDLSGQTCNGSVRSANRATR